MTHDEGSCLPVGDNRGQRGAHAVQVRLAFSVRPDTFVRRYDSVLHGGLDSRYEIPTTALDCRPQ